MWHRGAKVGLMDGRDANNTELIPELPWLSFFCVTGRSRSDESQSLTYLLADLTDMTLVSEDI